MLSRLFKHIQTSLTVGYLLYEDVREEQFFRNFLHEQETLYRQALTQAISAQNTLERLDFQVQHFLSASYTPENRLKKTTDVFFLSWRMRRNKFLRTRAQNQIIKARQSAHRAMAITKQILTITERTEAFKAVSEMERLWNSFPAASGKQKKVAQNSQQFRSWATRNGFALVWLILNMSFFYLLCYFAHLPTFLALLILPLTAFFLSKIWCRENSWFFHDASILWREMSRDMRLLVSKKQH